MDRKKGSAAERARARMVRQVALAVAFVLTSGWPASAHHSLHDNMYKTATYGPNCSTGTFCQTDNSDLSIYSESSVGAAQKTTINNMLAAQFAPTDLVVSYPTTPVYTGSYETDIIFQVGTSVPSGSDGITWCDDAVTTTKCDQHYVQFRSNSVINAGLACHEAGHAIGLTHGAEASPTLSQTYSTLECMASPVAAGEPLGSHNAYWVNITY